MQFSSANIRPLQTSLLGQSFRLCTSDGCPLSAAFLRAFCLAYRALRQSAPHVFEKANTSAQALQWANIVGSLLFGASHSSVQRCDTILAKSAVAAVNPHRHGQLSTHAPQFGDHNLTFWPPSCTPLSGVLNRDKPYHVVRC